MENKSIKVIVAHPGRQHSFKTATALKKAGMLSKYITTVYNKENSFIINLVSKLVKKDDQKRAKNRRAENLCDSDVVQFCQLGGFIELFIYRYFRKLYPKWHNFVSDRFGIKVAKYAIKSKADAVIMYDTNAGSCFEYLEKKAPCIVRIMDATHMNRNYKKTLFSKIKEDTFKEELEQMKNPPANLKRIRLENKYTQHILAASEFVKMGYREDGFPKENIHILPYGSYFSEKCENEIIDNKIRFIFVGQISYAKGISTLIEAFKKLPKGSATLKLIGNYDENSKIYSLYKDTEGVTFTGRLLHDAVKKELKEANAFVLPSFFEGMSLAGLEALGCGLPLICSENSGINDAVVDGQNGFVFPAGNIDSLYEKMLWFVNNQNKLKEMSDMARETAGEYTWENYEINLVNTIKKIMEKRGQR